LIGISFLSSLLLFNFLLLFLWSFFLGWLDLSLGWSFLFLLGWLGWGFGWCFSWSSWLLLFLNNWSWSWIGSLFGSFLFLKIFGEEFFISNVSLLILLPGINSRSLVENLSSNSLLSDKSLDLWCFIESLFGSVLAFLSVVFSSDNVLSNIILFSENESGSNVRCSLWSESSWSLAISESWNLSFTLNQNFKSNDGKIWSTDASSG